MKKLYAILLAICISMSANADYKIQSDMINMKPDDTATISLYGPAKESGLYYLIVKNDSPAALSNPQMTTATGNQAEAVFYSEADWTLSCYELTISDDRGSDYILAGLWATINLQCNAPGPITLSLYKAPDYENPLTTTQINTLSSLDAQDLQYCGGGESQEFKEQWDLVTAAIGEPTGWCDPRQCHGDANNSLHGKCGYYASTTDLGILVTAWNKNLFQLSAYGDPQILINADFDRRPQGKCAYRVSTNDLSILVANWNRSVFSGSYSLAPCEYVTGTQ